MKVRLILAATCALAAPGFARAAGEAAEMNRIYQACISSGGRAASSYSAWVAQNGCICDNSGKGSGSRTCSGATGAAAAPGSSGDLVTDATKNVVQGMLKGNSQQMGVGIMGIGVGAVLQGLQADPAADARRAREAAWAAEQQRLADEQRQAEVLRQQELAKQRILGLLKGSEQSTELALKTEDSDRPLVVAPTRGALGTTVIVPVGVDVPGPANGLTLKLGDDADVASTAAGQGFDTAGRIQGSELPPAPPTPASTAVPQQQAQRAAALLGALQRNDAEAQSLNDQLEVLQRTATPDPAALGEVQQKIATLQVEKKKILLDLSADDPDAPRRGAVPGNDGADPAPSGAVDQALPQ
jgi:hypothetical protein